MAENQDLESKLRHCADELDHCAALVRDHQIQPVEDNISKIGHIIADITDLLMLSESYRKSIKGPWKHKCSFCKKDEDQVSKLIVGPNVLICSECVDICVGIVKSGSEENAFENN